MVDFLHYGSKIVITENTNKVLDNEGVAINKEDTLENVIEKVNQTNKAHAKKNENGEVVIKQILKD